MNTYVVDDFTVHYIEHDEDVANALSDLSEFKYVGVDTETTGLDPTRPNQKLRLVQIGTSTKSYVFDVFKLRSSKHFIKKYLENTSIIKIFHNGLFDLKFLKVYLDCQIESSVFCTMLAAQLINCGNASLPANLKFVLGQYLGVAISKEERASDWSKDQLSDEQIMYSANDVRYLPQLRERLIKELRSLDLIEVATIEFNCLPAIVEKELNGFRLDVDKWKKLARLQHQRVLRYQIKISNILNPRSMLFDDIPSFNVGSTHQLKRFLRNNKIDIPKVKDKKTGQLKETLSIDHLVKIKKSHPIINKIIRHSQAHKLSTSYGENILKFVNPADGRIHCHYKQIGPETGRLSCNEPNLQQIPSNYRYRSCFVADDGYTLVSGDYSQIELRILAEFSKDENMIHAFQNGLDLHRFTAGLVYNVDYDKVNPIQRRKAKDLNFGIVYGIGIERFAEKSEMSYEEAETMIRNYFIAYPGLKRWLDNAGKFAVIKKYSLTMSRRRANYHFNPDNGGEVSLVRRNGCNMPIQGTSADITKIALPMCMKALRGMAKVIHSVHDEIVTEARLEYADQAKIILEENMIAAASAYMKLVPVKVDTKISSYWKK